MGPAWSTRLIAGCIVAVLIAVGAGFLVASAYMALAQSLSPPIAALILGAALIAAALLALLIASLISTRMTASFRERRHASVEPIAGAEAVAPELGRELGIVLRNLNPVTVGALILGAIVGLLRSRASRDS